MTGRLIVYLVVMAVSVVPAVFLNSVYGYLPFLFLLFLFLCSLLYAFLLKRSFAYEETKEADTVSRGKKSVFETTVHNTSLLVFPHVRAVFFLRDTLGNTSELLGADYSLNPHENQRFAFYITFAHLGDYTLGLKYMRIYDPLGLMFFTCKSEKETQIHVRPIRYDSGSINLENGEGVSTAQLTTVSVVTNQDYSGVREYTPGDPIKNIHWKLSAHTIKYLTKKYDNFSDNGVTVYLDVSMPGLEKSVCLLLYDTLIESAFSIACDVMDEGQSVQFICGRKGEIRLFSPRKEADVEEAVSHCPPAFSEDAADMAELLRSGAGRRAELDNILLFTANLGTELMYELESMKLKRKNPQLFYIVPPNSGVPQMDQTKQILKFLAGCGIPSYVVESVEKLKETVGAAS